FGGRETDTSSCLAFAPQSRRSRKTRSDWQVSNKDDFIKLEPYAVPCGVGWMKSNPTKWEGGSDLKPWECPFVATFGGYAFYTSELAIEKCLTVTYKMSNKVDVSSKLNRFVSPWPDMALRRLTRPQASEDWKISRGRGTDAGQVVRAVANDPDDRGPSESGVIMPADCELALFYHNHVLPFLAVSLLIVPSAHFVDDFYQSEDSEMARSVFSAFNTFHINLGFRMKVDGRQTALQKLRESTNGWGVIYVNPSDYIYWLESMAQLISIVANLSDEVFRRDFSKADDLGCQRL
ncbi:unnamed protein product, partial [Symbiodinium necroappetens]